MITLFIALAVAFGGFSASYWGADLGMGWSAFLAPYEARLKGGEA